jgi:acyl carrier protein
MTTRDQTRLLSAIAELARDRFGWEKPLERGTRLVEDLGLDSLKLMELAVTIENRFEIRIDEATESEIVTVGDLVDIIAREHAGASEGT